MQSLAQCIPQSCNQPAAQTCMTGAQWELFIQCARYKFSANYRPHEAHNKSYSRLSCRSCWKVTCQSLSTFQPCASSVPAATFYTIVLRRCTCYSYSWDWPPEPPVISATYAPASACIIITSPRVFCSVTEACALCVPNRAWPHMNLTITRQCTEIYDEQCNCRHDLCETPHDLSST